MKVSDAFPSRFVAATDLQGKSEVVAIVSRITQESLKRKNGEDEVCPILHFTSAKKGMVLNLTNAKRIAKLYGDDMDDWIGKPIILYATEVEAFGETTMAIRVKERIPTPEQMPGAAQAAAEEPPPPPEPEDFGGSGAEEEIPF